MEYTMRSFLVGAICGAACASLGFVLWPSATPVPQVAHVTDRELTPKPSPSLQTLTTAEPKPQAIASVVPPARDRADVGPAPTISVSPAVTNVTPIALSAEHAKVLTPPPTNKAAPTLPELHEQLLAQGKDPAWAPDMEQSIHRSLDAANSNGEFDITNVECRASICEVLAFGNSPTSGKLWNQTWDEMSKQDWYSSIAGNSTSSFAQNGRYTIVTILQRSKH